VSAALGHLLRDAGMGAEEAERKQHLFESAEQGLLSRNVECAMRCFVPGRIEVLGKHTDYAGGRSLLCAAERGMCVAAAPRRDSIVSIRDVVDGRSVEFELSPDAAVPPSGWTVYPLSVARRIVRNFGGELRGAEIALANDLPRASGMSSSSVLLIAVFAVLSHANRLEERPEYRSNIRNAEELAGYLACIENGRSFGTLAGDLGVGTFGGSEDHTAILCCRPGRLSQYSFCPVRAERTIQFPTDCAFVVAASGIRASKLKSAREQYNRISRAAEAVLAAWRSSSGENPATLAAAASSQDAPARMRKVLEPSSNHEFPAEVLLDRFSQFLIESEQIIPAAGDALERADLRAFGTLVDESQQAAERWLGNQIPETMQLARTARALGAFAASAFGAGFGGSVWALVSRAEAAKFCEEWKRSYEQLFPEAAATSQFLVTAPGPSLLSWSG